MPRARGGPTLEGVVIPPIPNPQSAFDNRHFPGRPRTTDPPRLAERPVCLSDGPLCLSDGLICLGDGPRLPRCRRVIPHSAFRVPHFLVGLALLPKELNRLFLGECGGDDVVPDLEVAGHVFLQLF